MKKLLFIFVIFITSNLSGQSFKREIPGCRLTSGGYVYQKEHLFENSGPIFIMTNSNIYFGIGPAIQFTYYKKNLYVPYGAIFQIGIHINDNILATLDLLYIHRNVFGQKINILTPQFGFAIKHCQIRYGYNTALENDLFPWVSKNKISIMYRIQK